MSYSQGVTKGAVDWSEEEGHANEVLKKQLEGHEKKSKQRRPLTAYNFYFSEDR